MPKRTRSYTSGLKDRLQDREYAVAYLNAALEDSEDEHSDSIFLLALRDVAEAQQVSWVARQSGLNRESLYRMLSRQGNPRLSSFKAVLRALNLKLAIVKAAEEPPSAQEDVHAAEVVPCGMSAVYTQELPPTRDFVPTEVERSIPQALAFPCPAHSKHSFSPDPVTVVSTSSTTVTQIHHLRPYARRRGWADRFAYPA